MASEPKPVSAPSATKKNLLASMFGPLTRKNVLSWLTLILLVLSIRWLIFEPYTIPTGSMEPTLHGDMRWFRGDHVAVNKVIYGPRVPFMNKRIFHLYEPQRWDIVVFKSLDPKAKHGTLVKRVVGLPGEQIQIRDGKIYVNGNPVEPPESLRSVLNYSTRLQANEAEVHQFAAQMAAREWRDPELNPHNAGVQKLYEELAGLRQKVEGQDVAQISAETAKELYESLTPVSQKILTDLVSRKIEEQYPLRYGVLPEDEFSVVPSNSYLVCGDNSLDSADGRVFGWLPNDHILGRVSCVYWPIPRWRDFTGFSNTWWGMALLYGVPGFIVAFELHSYLRRRAKKLAQD